MTVIQLHTPEQAASWLQARVTGTLWADSRRAGKGDGFVAWPGAATDGRNYVNTALAEGVNACLVEHAGSEIYGFTGDRVATFEGLKAATGPIAAAYFAAPSAHLQLVAITGTNGKTSTAWWLAQALGRLGRKCGMVGTLGIGEPGALVPNGLTTPDPVLLQHQLRRFADEGFSACALEASSIGLEEQRLDATCIQVAVFTNFTQDHLDYHTSMSEYWQAKKRLFSWPGLQAAVINSDDPKGLELSRALADGSLDIWTFSCTGPARVQAQEIHQGTHDLNFEVAEGDERYRLAIPMVGLYSVSNLLGVICSLRALRIPLADAVHACANLLPVPGRAETLAVTGLPLVVIDYAHTPDALEKVLTALKPVALNRGGRLWCVFGCGGDRDPTKRPLMAAVAEKNADQVMVTSDNPRSEDPMAIIEQILQGFSHSHAAEVRADRAAAIADALRLASSSDVVLLAGKGHEDYQEIKGVKFSFSDRDQAQAALNTIVTACKLEGATS
ncbi:MAG: UDP-N-acetylmuramoylalanyl-D-glutamate--2,6-diaminopimelate ligase [Polaromonas sp.]|nr:UDP-N-acetylmuramoylalanyl-D-glutamate--2,6-diaminopimelate ligase [Polaromonas sp.]